LSSEKGKNLPSRIPIFTEAVPLFWGLDNFVRQGKCITSIKTRLVVLPLDNRTSVMQSQEKYQQLHLSSKPCLRKK